jgi:hypothetical protein
MSTAIETTEAPLTNTSGEVRTVQLRLVVRELKGTCGVEDRQVSRCELISDDVPYGNYLLDYFYMQPAHRNVRVVSGRLLAG